MPRCLKIRELHLLLSVAFFILAGLFHKGGRIMEPALDENGHQLFNDSNQPIYQRDTWANLQDNWPSHLLLTASGLLFATVIASGIREQISRHRARQARPPSTSRPRDDSARS